ncbi:MAG: sulfotransferase family protein [Phycisphaerales bacterium]|nr:sulfotransferase family protein [Phycisphaerales bacterium]
MNDIDTREPVIVVSGLPRSGTSMAMQMLQAGGIAVMTDARRTPDLDNPRGYLEFERVKQLKSDKSWLADAQGKAVKVIHLLVMELPEDRRYRVIFMRRDLREVVRSQAVMLERSGKAGGALAPQRMMALYEQQLQSVFTWLAARPGFEVLELDHAACLADPRSAAAQINAFLGGTLNESAMVAAVDPSLHRNKT